ncbi:hypothetical protein BCU68_03230 [Vibrio sp. 10N.286.49.B3]|uniref:porin n=1 Tax=Vibrio sp. 10N.286.49.B3 TaxID=1880855 RepID=UPI000C858C0C|nr:porin [Vibrio sp. 10N.286.49.B3]PMH44527.1 hypothetical protein BCU68_03230 [Vibrio sp. 10N.286.49.B3]
MKKAVISTAILAALVSGSSLAATVYSNDGTELKIGGRVEFRGDFGDASDGTMADKTRSRLNVGGTTQIADGLSAFGFYEAEHSSGSKEFSNRYIYAGLDTNVGAFSAGKQNTAAVQISDMTDITEFSGGQQVIAAGSDKQDGTFAYRGNFADLSLEVSYLASDEKDADGYGISGLYAMPFGLDIGLAYSADDEQNQFLGAVGYSIDNLYIAASYSFGETFSENANDDYELTDFTSLELAAQYKITSQFRITALYGLADAEFADGKTDTTDFFELGARYDFAKSFRIYTAIEFDQLGDEDTTVRLGARYDF